MSTRPEKPDSKEWYEVLDGNVDEETLRWLLKWASGWPELRDDPTRTPLWAALLTREGLLEERHLVQLLVGGDGPPSARAALLVLQHPSAELEVRWRLGYTSTSAGSRWTNAGDHASAALGWDDDDRSTVAHLLARGHSCPVDLLSASVALYRDRFDTVLDPRRGGGPERTETFLALHADGWYAGSGALVTAVERLVPARAEVRA